MESGLGLRRVACVAMAAAIGLAFSGVAAGPADALEAQSVAQMAERLLPAVVTITTPGGSGSGVIVDPSGVIISSMHVLHGETQASVRLANGDVYDEVTVLDADVRRDLIVLKVKAFGLPVVPMADSGAVVVGDTAFVIGSPRGLRNTLTNGLISAIRDSGEGYRLFQTSAAVSPGSSGGGLFNEKGELVGIVTSKIADAENLNFAVPLNYARGMLASTQTLTLAELATRYPLARDAVTAPAVPTAPSSPGAANAEARLRRIVEASALASERVDNAWRVPYNGVHADAIRVYISAFEDLAVVQSQPIWRQELTAGQMTEMLAWAFSTNLVKVGRADDAVIVLAELDVRTLDPTLLARVADAVAAGADELFDRLSRAPAADTTASTPGATGPAGAGIIEEVTYAALEGPGDLRRATTLDLVRGGASLVFDQAEWTLVPAAGDTVEHYEHTSGDAYFRVIAERAQVPFERLEAVVLENARALDPDMRVVRRGWREVNGRRLRVMEMSGQASGVPIVLVGHYLSDRIGTIQIIGWAAGNLIDEYRGDIDRVVAGFRVK